MFKQRYDNFGQKIDLSYISSIMGSLSSYLVERGFGVVRQT